MASGRPVIVLIGAPGAGKSRLGKRVAKILGAPFVDSDKRIVARHGAIANIFAEHGEPHFRALERMAVAEALTEHAVVALGGGAVLDADTQRDLAGQRVVLLTVDSDAVVARINSGKRPLVSGIESWKTLVASRADLYASLASRTFDTSHRPLDAIADEIVAWVRETDEPEETGTQQ